MVNLSDLRIRITGPIPRRFRYYVEDEIYDTFVNRLYEMSIFSDAIENYVFKIEYYPWKGFYITISDSVEKPYAHIAMWTNDGTKGKKIITPKHSNWLVFKQEIPFKPKTNFKIPGNEAFSVLINGTPHIFAKAVHHPGIEAKNFFYDIIEDEELNKRLINAVVDNLRKSKMDIDLKSFSLLMNKFKRRYREMDYSGMRQWISSDYQPRHLFG